MTPARLLLCEEVIAADDYRAFLRESFAALRRNSKAFSLARFAEKAGFGSRGFIVDVMKGRKRLTTQSTTKVMLGLGLTGKLKALFILLLERDEPELRRTHLKLAETEMRLVQLRQMLRQDLLGATAAPPDPRRFYASTELLRAYASLGSAEHGASLEEVAARAGIKVDRTGLLLAELLRDNIIEQKDGRYRALNHQLVFEKLGRSLDFQNIFLEALKQIQSEARQNFPSEEKLFFHSVVPVERAKLPELKARLRAVATEFIHEHQCDEGNHIATAQVALL